MASSQRGLLVCAGVTFSYEVRLHMGTVCGSTGSCQAPYPQKLLSDCASDPNNGQRRTVCCLGGLDLQAVPSQAAQ